VDYVDLQRLMYMLNAHYRSRSFQVSGDSMVAQAFRGNLRNGFENVVRSFQEQAIGDPDGESPSRGFNLGANPRPH